MSVRLYVDAALRSGAELELPEAASRHVQVRRLQPGDALCLFNGLGGEWQAEVLRVGRSRVTVRVLGFDDVQRELPVRVTVALGMPANERMDILVEKATELGVHTIVPLHTERSVLRLEGERAERKRAHWQAIAAAAAGQCGRTRLPQVAAVQRLADWLAQPPDAACRLLLSPAEGALPLAAATAAAAAAAAAMAAHPADAANAANAASVADVANAADAANAAGDGGATAAAIAAASPASLLTLSGPEGGLSPAEQDAARARGFLPVRLGPRVLRAETAPLAVLAWIGLNA